MQPTTATDQDFIADFAERWEGAWNSHQPERLLELMTEDIVYDDSAWPQTMRSHGDVREFLDSVWRAMPDLQFEMVEGPFLHPSERTATFYWKGTGPGRSDTVLYAPTGRSSTIEVVAVDEAGNTSAPGLTHGHDPVRAAHPPPP